MLLSRLSTPMLVLSLLGCSWTLDVDCDASPEACYWLDSGVDSGVDAGRDAGPTRSDAGRDAGPPVDGGPLDPGWVPLEGLPEGCLVERAEYPERLPVPEWESCGPGCLRTRANAVPDVDWLPTSVTSSTAEGNWGAILLYRSNPMGVTMLTTIEGPVAAAWRRHVGGAPVCHPALLSADPSRAALLIRHCADDMCQDQNEFIFAGTAAELARAERPTLSLTEPVVQYGRTTRSVAVADTYLAVLLQPTGRLYRSADGELETLHEGGAFEVRAEGDHLVWSDHHSPTSRLMHYVPSRGAEPYFAPDGEWVTFPFLVEGTLYFVRLVDWSEHRWERAELWATPFMEDPSEVAPRLIHDNVLPNGNWGPTLYARVWEFEPEFRVQLVDLADGRERWMGPPEEGARCISLRYASATEILLECAIGRSAYLYRVDPRGLPYLD